MFPFYIFKILSVFSFLFNTGLNDIRREDKVGKYIPLARINISMFDNWHGYPENKIEWMVYLYSISFY